MRNFIVIEKEKKYFDLAARRLAQERNELKEQLDIAFGAS
jgi:DNA modification methylase